MSQLIRTCAFAIIIGIFTGVDHASAQTTVVLDDPSHEIADGYIRAGIYANNVYNSSILVTKANSDLDYLRRALLRFDTENFIPAGASIASAKLTLTLKSSESDTRTLGAYRVANLWHESGVTWHRRLKTGEQWQAAGGDLAERYAEAVVGTTPGTRITFDVTPLVQKAVNGAFATRYTRIALVDLGSSSSRSYKAFHSSEASDPAVRPRLTVVYGASSSPAPAPASSPEPTSTVRTLKVLHWNIHYGLSTDGIYGMDKYVDWIVRMDPDLVSLNEVEKYVSSHGNEDQPAVLASKLAARTGVAWYYHFAQRWGNWSSKGGGNLILSRFPIEARAQLELSYDRSAALVTVIVNGRTVNFASTHLANASEGSTKRATQIKELMAWARGFSEERIIAGDFNAGLSNLPYIEAEYNDAWTAAAAAGTAQDYPGNYRFGSTYINGYRIDFIFTSEKATSLTVTGARMFDTRDADGDMPSDHKPLLVTYSLQ